MATIAGVTISLSADSKQLGKQLRRAGSLWKKYAKNVIRDLRKLSRLTATIIGVPLAAIFLLTKRMADLGDAIAKSARNTGLSRQEFQQMSYVFNIVGSDVHGMTRLFTQMARSVEDATNGLITQSRAFRKLGLDVDALAQLSPARQFFEIVNAMSQIESQSRRIALSQQIFSTTGKRLGTLFNEPIEYLQDLVIEFEKLGIVFSDLQLDRAEQLNDEIYRIRQALSAGFASGFLEALDLPQDTIPIFQEWRAVMERIGLIVGELIEQFIRLPRLLPEVSQAIRKNIDVFLNYGRAIGAVLIGLAAIGQVVPGIGNVVGFKLGAAGVGLLTSATFLQNTLDTVSDGFSRIIDGELQVIDHFGQLASQTDRVRSAFEVLGDDATTNTFVTSRAGIDFGLDSNQLNTTLSTEIARIQRVIVTDAGNVQSILEHIASGLAGLGEEDVESAQFALRFRQGEVDKRIEQSLQDVTKRFGGFLAGEIEQVSALVSRETINFDTTQAEITAIFERAAATVRGFTTAAGGLTDEFQLLESVTTAIAEQTGGVVQAFEALHRQNVESGLAELTQVDQFRASVGQPEPPDFRDREIADFSEQAKFFLDSFRQDLSNGISQTLADGGGFKDIAISLVDSLIFAIQRSFQRRLDKFLQKIFDAFFNSLIDTITKSLSTSATGTSLTDRVAKIFEQFGEILGNALSKLFSGAGGGLFSLGSFIGGLLPFQDGGFVPGRAGEPVPSLVHGGELILNPDQQNELFNRLGGMTVNIENNITGDIDQQTLGVLQRNNQEVADIVNARNIEERYVI